MSLAQAIQIFNFLKQISSMFVILTLSLVHGVSFLLKKGTGRVKRKMQREVSKMLPADQYRKRNMAPLFFEKKNTHITAFPLSGCRITHFTLALLGSQQQAFLSSSILPAFIASSFLPPPFLVFPPFVPLLTLGQLIA